MLDKPIIGITGGRKQTEGGVMLLYTLPSYIHALEMAGGLPVIIPVTLNPSALEVLYRRLDGIVLTGGGDVLPSAYGAEIDAHIYGTDAVRDIAEINLARWAVHDDKPLLAICRGHQVLNVAMGGTLHRHIPNVFDTDIQHDNALATHRTYLAHTANIAAGSNLALALGEVETPVNSMHHQAIDRVGKDLHVVSHAPDGIVEGVEHPERRFVLGVQWHPEELVDTHPAMRRLFWTFVQAANGCEDWILEEF